MIGILMCGRFAAVENLFEIQEKHGEYLVDVHLNADKLSRQELEATLRAALLVKNVNSEINEQRGTIRFHVSLFYNITLT